MITIDLVQQDNTPIFRYLADVVPRVGETISTHINSSRCWEVEHVDYLVQERLSVPSLEKNRLSVVSVTVIPI